MFLKSSNILISFSINYNSSLLELSRLSTVKAMSERKIVDMIILHLTLLLGMYKPLVFVSADSSSWEYIIKTEILEGRVMRCNNKVWNSAKTEYLKKGEIWLVMLFIKSRLSIYSLSVLSVYVIR
jgi:hypothetical protein